VGTKKRQYSPELRVEVVKSVLEDGLTPAQAARNFGLVPETVRTWVKKAREERHESTPAARDAGARAELAEKDRRIRELEQENAFLVKAAAFFAKKQR
jgi:transposase